MQKTKKFLGNSVKQLTAAIAVLGLAGALVLPATAGAQSAAIGGMTLVFSGGNAHSVADNVAVPVECLGEGDGFCSGVVTLSRSGHRISVPFSVRGGSHEVLFVPLRLHGGATHPRKVHGVATTVQPQGPATTTKEFLYAK